MNATSPPQVHQPEGAITNPYLDQLNRLPAYRRFDPSLPRLLAEVSLDPEEDVVASIRCNHGQYRVGHMAITTRRLRWFQRLLTRSHDHWPLETTMVLDRGMPPVVVLASGDQFQARSLRPGPTKEFVALHQVMVEAMRWDTEHLAPAAVPVVMAGSHIGLTAELASLDDLRTRGLLSEVEFAAAKTKLLGIGG